MLRSTLAQTARRTAGLLGAAALLAALLPSTAAATIGARALTAGGGPAAPTSSTVALVKVADVTDPVLAIGARDGSGRLFIVAKGGRIRIV